MIHYVRAMRACGRARRRLLTAEVDFLNAAYRLGARCKKRPLAMLAGAASTGFVLARWRVGGRVLRLAWRIVAGAESYRWWQLLREWTQ